MFVSRDRSQKHNAKSPNNFYSMTRLGKNTDTNNKQHYTLTMDTCACVQRYLKKNPEG